MIRTISAIRVTAWLPGRLATRSLSTQTAMAASENYGESYAEETLTEDVIPHVDITPYIYSEATAQDRLATASSIDEACRNVGFFTIDVPEHSKPVLERLYSRADEFFSLPLETKKTFLVEDSSAGYTPVGGELNVSSATSDIHEALDVSMKVTPQGVELSKSLNWADPRLAALYEDIVDYNWNCFATGRAVVEAMLDGLGVSADRKPTLLNSFEYPQSGLRLLKYPATGGMDLSAKTASGAPLGLSNGEHTDYECLTLLHSTSPGLEVKLLDSDWFGVPILPDRYVCNVGDAMSFWSGGVYVSTPHRVRRVAHERWSIPFFLGPIYSTPLTPLVATEQSASAPELTYGEYLDGKFTAAFPKL